MYSVYLQKKVCLFIYKTMPIILRLSGPCMGVATEALASHEEMKGSARFPFSHRSVDFEHRIIVFFCLMYLGPFFIVNVVFENRFSYLGATLHPCLR